MDRARRAVDLAIIAVYAVLGIGRERAVRLVVPAYNIKPAGLVTRLATGTPAVKFDDIHILLLAISYNVTDFIIIYTKY